VIKIQVAARKKNMTAKIKSQLEFILLMASLMSMVALSIDAILPGLNSIGEGLNIHNNNDLQMIISMIFLGLGIGQLVFGTLADSLGRKPVVYAGVTVFFVASIICVNANSLEMMLVGRFLQGAGLSAARSVSTTIIRDLYVGDQMARIMSFITVTFIIVPMIAPVLGQTILNHFQWSAIFYFQMLFALIIIIWFAVRQEETLPDENKIKLTHTIFYDGVKEFFKFEESVIYTLISGFMTGGFMVYLSASKQIFQDQYGFTEEFVYIFAGLAFFMGLSTFLNGSLVLRFGMKSLSNIALVIYTINALVYSALFYNSINPSLYLLLFFLAVQFMSQGFIFGNVKALTMQPIGHIAGIGASFSGFISTLLAVPFAIFIGKQINGTALPLFLGFLICGFCSIMLIYVLRTLNNSTRS
jgi:DHA1 family bicyclomycin/chloramphenicol resistance-like MFS transporter